MNSKHRATLAAIFASPTRADVEWTAIEALLLALGAKRSEGAGSRVRFVLNGVPGVFHRPHPPKETDRGALKSVRKFLVDAGVAS